MKLINFGPALRSEAIEEISTVYGITEFVSVRYPEDIPPDDSLKNLLARLKAHVLDLLGGEPLQIYVPPSVDGITSRWIMVNWPQASYIVMSPDRMPVAIVNPAGGIQFTKPFGLDFTGYVMDGITDHTDASPTDSKLE